MLGIVQGRLSYSGRKLQFFPPDPFKEFKIASQIGYDFIELFGERKINKKNPIWSNSGITKYISVAKKNNVNDLSKGINWVLTKNTKTLGLKARNKVERDFNSDLIAKKYLKTYSMIL